MGDSVIDDALKKLGLSGKFDKAWGLGNPIYIRYTGLFDFDELYASIVDWGKGYGYQWFERNYKHKVPKPDGAEQEFVWLLGRDINEFVRYEINIETHLWDMVEVEVDTGKKKKKLTNARIEILITGKVVFDIEGKYADSNRWVQMFGQLYKKVVQKEFEVQHWDNLYYRIYSLSSMIKKKLDVEGKKKIYGY